MIELLYQISVFFTLVISLILFVIAVMMIYIIWLGIKKKDK